MVSSRPASVSLCRALGQSLLSLPHYARARCASFEHAQTVRTDPFEAVHVEVPCFASRIVRTPVELPIDEHTRADAGADREEHEMGALRATHASVRRPPPSSRHSRHTQARPMHFRSSDWRSNAVSLILGHITTLFVAGSIIPATAHPYRRYSRIG